ncbi:DUF397 domain-containing protein [Streptacidiphilus albus]|uniref:DUF397 domain-containing protein n=1 Tax=Streptacidiphilus albus TaxID=105425 RepID=UPI00068FF977|nr:DUF397 domain-containing protein [Streptacidiphilus albus]
MSTPLDLAQAKWRKSTYSGQNGGDCIEADHVSFGDAVPVRDSKDVSGPVLAFSAAAWSAFVDAVKSGELPGV